MATVTTLLRIGPADHGRTISLDEFEEADFEEGYRYELARGVLEVSEVPGEPHALIVWAILRLIAGYDRDHPRIIHRAGGGSEYRFRLPVMISGRHPDVAVTLRNTPRDGRGFRTASMAFEVVSEGSEARERDDVTKWAEYLAYGLREVCLRAFPDVSYFPPLFPSTDLVPRSRVSNFRNHCKRTRLRIPLDQPLYY